MRQGPGFPYSNEVSYGWLVALIVCVEFRDTTLIFLIESMLPQPLNGYHNGIFHLGWNYSPNPCLLTLFAHDCTSWSVLWVISVLSRAIFFLVIPNWEVSVSCLVTCLKRRFINSLSVLNNSPWRSVSDKFLISCILIVFSGPGLLQCCQSIPSY